MKVYKVSAARSIQDLQKTLDEGAGDGFELFDVVQDGGRYFCIFEGDESLRQAIEKRERSKKEDTLVSKVE